MACNTIKYDVVYVVGKDSEWGDHEELRYSIRSVAKHFLDLGKIYIVGHLPDWTNEEEVIHLKLNDPYKDNKDANLINKVIWACFDPNLSQKFVRMSDDQYFLKDLSLADFKNPYNLEDLKGKNYPPGKYFRRQDRTCRVLQNHELDTLNYDTHMPVVIDKTMFPRVMLNYDYGNLIGYCINTLYFNSVEHFDFREAPEFNDEWRRVKLTIEEPMNMRVIDKQMSGKSFFNFGGSTDGKVSGLNVSLKKKMALLYQTKTIYEK